MSQPTATTPDVSTREAEFFDRYVKDKGDFNPFADRGWRTLQKRFEEMIQPQGKINLLDVGCGTGQSRQIYKPYTKRYLGIDLSPEAIEIAKHKHPEAEWQVADATQTPFEPHSFDVVAFSSVLHHIPDFTRALVEAKRLLRPGGKVFAFDPNLRHPAMFLFRNPKSPFYLKAGVSPNERPLWPVELRKAFEAAGLTDIRQRCQADIPYRAVAPKLINACLSLYNAGDWIMEKIGLGRIMGSFIITSARA
jgi:ubiquinone/menaquinone biosynthesis C-methylase UbiE